MAEPGAPGLAAAPIRRDALPGLMIATMLGASIAHGIAPAFPARGRGAGGLDRGMCAVWTRLPRRAQVQVGLMIGIGLACIAAAAGRGVEVDWSDVTGRSLPILTLLAGVAFLRLVYVADAARGAGAAAPRGFGAYLRTMAGVHLFGAVINISALVVFADRLARSGPLGRREITMLARSVLHGRLLLAVHRRSRPRARPGARGAVPPSWC